MRTVPNNAQVIRLIAVIAFNDDTTHIHGRTPRTPTTVRVEAIPPLSPPSHPIVYYLHLLFLS